jgi:hypothetical protein
MTCPLSETTGSIAQVNLGKKIVVCLLGLKYVVAAALEAQSGETV